MIIIERILLDISYIATIIGMICIVYQLMQSKKNKKVEFEENIEREYRELIKEIPYDVFLNYQIEDIIHKKLMDKYYRYIDYSNSQIGLRKNNVISKKTWEDWQEGIISNFCKNDIKKALEEIIINNMDIFRELRYFLHEKTDPKNWKKESIIEYIKNENEEIKNRRTTASTL